MMQVLKRARFGVVLMAVIGGLIALPSPAPAQADLTGLCSGLATPPGGQFINPVLLLAEETAGDGCLIVLGEVYAVTSVVESQLGSATGSG